MIGDRSISLLAFFAAALLHMVIVMLVSYMPMTKVERRTPPSRTRYVVQFRPPVPTVSPTIAPTPLTSQAAPILPAPAAPLPKQPTPAPVPVRIAKRQAPPVAVETPRPEPLPKPVETPAPPRQPAQQPKEPVRVQPRRQPPAVAKASPVRPLEAIKRPEQVAVRKPADIKTQPTARREAVAAPAPRSAPATQELQMQYLTLVAQTLQRHKRYPRAARRRGLSGKVVLDFVILPNGQITDARIVARQSTRHNILRQSALRTLKRANPLPPFPKTLNQPSLRVTLPILYELTER